MKLGELYVEMQRREWWAWARAMWLSQSQAHPFQGDYFPILPSGPSIPFAPAKPVREQMCISTGLHPLATVPVEEGQLRDVSIRRD